MVLTEERRLDFGFKHANHDGEALVSDVLDKGLAGEIDHPLGLGTLLARRGTQKRFSDLALTETSIASVECRRTHNRRWSHWVRFERVDNSECFNVKRANVDFRASVPQSTNSSIAQKSHTSVPKNICFVKETT